MQFYAQYLIVFVLIAFGVYRRVRRTIGFQPLSVGRLKFRIGIFTVIGLLILALGVLHPASFIGDAVGVAAGLLLVRYAVKHTVFEKREDQWYYRTHVWVQTTVLVLFLSRLVFRLLYFYTLQKNGTPAGAAQPQTFTNDPWTAAVLFVLVTYYIGYFLYVIRREKRLSAEAGSGTGA